MNSFPRRMDSSLNPPPPNFSAMLRCAISHPPPFPLRPYLPHTFNNTPMGRGPQDPYSARVDYPERQSQTVPDTLLGSVSHGPLPRSLLQRAHGSSTTDLF